MGWDADTRLACREVLVGGLPTKLFRRPEGSEWSPWGYGTTANHEWSRACAACATALRATFAGAANRLGGDSVERDRRLDDARYHLLLLISGNPAANQPGLLHPVKLPHPNGSTVWSNLGLRPDGTPSRAEWFPPPTYCTHWYTPAVTVAVVAREVGDTEVFEAIRRLFSAWSALHSLLRFRAVYWPGGPKAQDLVVTPCNRCKEPTSGPLNGFDDAFRGRLPRPWTLQHQSFADDWAVLAPHRKLIAELGADDTMLSPPACEDLEVQRGAGSSYLLRARGLPMIESSRGTQDLIGEVAIGSDGDVVWGQEPGSKPYGARIALIRGDMSSWMPSPRARGAEPVTPPVEPPADDPGPDDDAIRGWTLEQLAAAPPPWAGGKFAVGWEKRRRELAAYIISECERLGPKFRAGLRRP